MLTRRSGLYRVKSSELSLPSPADTTLTLSRLSGNQYITSRCTRLNSVGGSSLPSQYRILTMGTSTRLD